MSSLIWIRTVLHSDGITKNDLKNISRPPKRSANSGYNTLNGRIDTVDIVFTQNIVKCFSVI